MSGDGIEVCATGGCLCGAVRYEVRGDLRAVAYCHCSQCRRFHGHIGAYTLAASDDFVLNEDRGLKWFPSSEASRRAFCSDCGSSLFWKSEERDGIAIAAGSLDQPTGVDSMDHIFVADKADYYAITDDLPQSAQWRE